MSTDALRGLTARWPRPPEPAAAPQAAPETTAPAAKPEAVPKAKRPRKRREPGQPKPEKQWKAKWVSRGSADYDWRGGVRYESIHEYDPLAAEDDYDPFDRESDY